jgi:hypothetical protein
MDDNLGSRPRWALSLVMLTGLAGCAESEPSAFGPPAVTFVYLDFQPEKEFRRLGCQVEPATGGGRSSAREAYG